MNYLSQIINKSTLLNIKFWIIAFFILRLFHITNPPLEVSHNWRQTTVTMVARNFEEVNNNIFYPRLDFDGDSAGVTGMEFPVFNYLIYLMSLLFGYEHWYGRLINLIVSSFGIYFFYKLIRKHFNGELAFFSAIILLCSIWFPFSRKIMPDTFSFSFMIMCMYYGSNYFENGRFKNLLFYFIFCALGVLSKLPSGYILIIFSFFLLDKKYAFDKKIIFCAVSAIIISMVGIWYFYWVPRLNSVFSFQHFYMGSTIYNGYVEFKNNLFDTIAKFFDSALKYIGFIFFVIGLYKAYKLKSDQVFYVFIVAFFGFLIVMFKAGFAFHHHNYYIIPFAPVMALVSAYGILKIKFQNTKYDRLKYVFLVAISLEGTINYNDDFFIKEDDYRIFFLEKDLNKCGHKKDLILINSGNKPTPIYYAHRKGWVTFNDSIKNPVYLNKLKRKGLKFIVILKKSFGDEIILDYPICYSNTYYTIYELK